MADATTLSVGAVTLNASSVTIDTFVVKDVEFTPEEELHHRVQADTAGGTTLELGMFSACTLAIVTNLDAANFVNVSIKNAAGATVVTKLLALQCLVTPDIDPTGDLKIVADTAACLCDVLVIGT